MSHGSTPVGGRGGTLLDRVVSTARRVEDRLRIHIREWPRRYVEMQTDAVDS